MKLFLSAIIPGALCMLSATAASAESVPLKVSCAIPDFKGGVSTVPVVGLARDNGNLDPPSVAYAGATTDGSWKARKTFQERKGSDIFWTVDPASLGISSERAIAAFAEAGIKARPFFDGLVRFDGKNGQELADKAFAVLVGAGWSPYGMISDVALLRLEGRFSDDATQFAQAAPAGATVTRFGTGYAIHFPAALSEEMWKMVDEEGRRNFVVGASSALTIGEPVSSAIQFCGATAELRSFPTPYVRSQAGTGIVLDSADGGLISMFPGDTIVTVQTPKFESGLLVAISKVRRP